MTGAEKDALCDVVAAFSMMPPTMTERILWGNEPSIYDTLTLGGMREAARMALDLVSRLVRAKRGG